MIRIIMAVVAVIALISFAVGFHNSHRRNLLKPTTDLESWTWWQQLAASGGVSVDDGALKFTITNCGPEPVSLQMYQRQFQLSEGKKYRIAFQAKASKERSIVVADGYAIPSSRTGAMGFSKTVVLDTNWKNFEYTFTAHDVDNKMDKLPWIQVGGMDGTVWMKDIVCNEL
jgi:hypothetical protein